MAVYGDIVYFKPQVRAHLAKPLQGPWEFVGLSGVTALLHRVHPWVVQWQPVAAHPGNLTTTRIPPGVMGREQKPFPQMMPVQRFPDTFEMIKRHAQLALEARARKRAMSTAASFVPQNSVCDLGQEVAWAGVSMKTPSTIIGVPCYMMMTEPVSSVPPSPAPYCFRSAIATSLDSPIPSSVKPYDSPADWTPDQWRRKIFDHVRGVVRRLRLDLGFLATVLRIHFGVEYLQEENPHPCLDPNIPYGQPSFAPEQRPWLGVPEDHFTAYAADLCNKKKDSEGSSTPAGRISTMVVEVITNYVGLRDTVSEGAWVPPPTDLGPYMTCIIERVLDYMLYCRMMTRYEHVLTPITMFQYALLDMENPLTISSMPSHPLHMGRCIS